MSFIAEIHLSNSILALSQTIEENPDTTIRREYETIADEGDTTITFSAFGDDFEAFEASLERDPTVTDPTRIATFGNRCVYRVRSVTDRQLIPTKCSELGMFVFQVTSATDGWSFRLHVPDRDALLELREYCLAHDIAFRVDRLYDSDSAEENTAAGLTDRQRDLLLLAFYEGYFDVPRRLSQSDLADQLDVSTSAVSQQLRRAIEQLIVTTLSTEELGP